MADTSQALQEVSPHILEEVSPQVFSEFCKTLTVNKQLRSCQLCRQANQNFLKDFYHRIEEAHLREEAMARRIRKLEWDNSQYAGALQHAGLSNQADRIALNYIQNQFTDAQAILAEKEKALAKEQLEHHDAQKLLHYERQCRKEGDQFATCVLKMEEILKETSKLDTAEIKRQILAELDDFITSNNSNNIALRSRLEDEMQISEEKEFRLAELYIAMEDDKEKISTLKKIIAAE